MVVHWVWDSAGFLSAANTNVDTVILTGVIDFAGPRPRPLPPGPHPPRPLAPSLILTLTLLPPSPPPSPP